MGRLERYIDAVNAIRAVGVSQDRWVTVSREPSGDIDVRVRNGMLRMCTPDQVAREIKSALVATLVDHRKQYRQLRIDHFGSPLGVEAFTPVDPEPKRTRMYEV